MKSCKWCTVTGLVNPDGLCRECRERQQRFDLEKVIGANAAMRVDKVEWYITSRNTGWSGSVRQ